MIGYSRALISKRRFDFVSLKHAPPDFPKDSTAVYQEAVSSLEANAFVDYIQRKLKRFVTDLKWIDLYCPL